MLFGWVGHFGIGKKLIEGFFFKKKLIPLEKKLLYIKNHDPRF